jgi:hypothetical protein
MSLNFPYETTFEQDILFVLVEYFSNRDDSPCDVEKKRIEIGIWKSTKSKAMKNHTKIKLKNQYFCGKFH